MIGLRCERTTSLIQRARARESRRLGGRRVEWSSTVRGDAISVPGRDTEYRYTGLALLRVRGGKIAEQGLCGDCATLAEQLAAGRAAK